LQTLPLIFRTLLKVPRLARLIKHVQWASDPKQIVLASSAQATDLIRSLEIPIYYSWVIGLEEACRDIILGMLLCMAPQIEDFSVYTSDQIVPNSIPGYVQPLLCVARSKPFGTTNSFKDLSYLSIRYCSTRPSKFSALFNLPALASLELYAVEVVEDESIAARTAWPEECLLWMCSPNSPCLKRLSISGTPWSMAISTMIISCSSLSFFHFSGDAWLRTDPTWFRVVEKAFQTQTRSLQRLSLGG
jgi:hypothetical protein